MRRAAALLPLLCLLLPAATLAGKGEAPKSPDPEPPAKAEATLELRTTTPVVRLGSSARFTAKLTNTGKVAITVVLPGEGSDYGMRTPVITWSPAQKRLPRCGVIGGPRADGIVTLAPGKSVTLSGTGHPGLGKAGKHEVRLTYENAPGRRWPLFEVNAGDKAAMAKVRSSTPLRVTSNAVKVEVQESEAEAGLEAQAKPMQVVKPQTGANVKLEVKPKTDPDDDE